MTLKGSKQLKLHNLFLNSFYFAFVIQVKSHFKASSINTGGTDGSSITAGNHGNSTSLKSSSSSSSNKNPTSSSVQSTSSHHAAASIGNKRTHESTNDVPGPSSAKLQRLSDGNHGNTEKERTSSTGSKQFQKAVPGSSNDSERVQPLPGQGASGTSVEPVPKL